MAVLWILLLAVGLYLLLGLLYRRFWNKGLRAQLTFTQEYGVEGQESTLREVVENDKLLPLPAVEISFHMDKGLQFSQGDNSSVSDATYRRDIFALGPRQRITRSLDFVCGRRGYYRIDEAGLLARDLAMSQQFLTAFPQNTSFYVLPRPVDAQRIAIPFSQLMGSVISKKRVYDDPLEFAGLRGYSREDPMKYINWKATAWEGELLVNLHESTLSQTVTLLVDMEGKGVQQADVLNEEGVRVAASLCRGLLSAGIQVEVYSNGTDVLTGKPLAVGRVAGAGSDLSLQKKFACLQAGNGLPPIQSFFPAPGEGEGRLLVLISRSQREDLCRDLAAWAGKRPCLHIAPYLAEHPDLPEPGNLRRLWWQA